MLRYDTKNILGVDVANVTLMNVVPIIFGLISLDKKVTVYGANSHSINFYYKDPTYRQALNNATFVYPEGIATVLTSRILGNPLKGKTTLMDFIFNVFKTCEKKKWRIYLLGGREEVSEKALRNLKTTFPSLKIYGHHGYFSKNETKQIIADINKIKPKILFVAMGTPMQEVWIEKYKNKIEANAFFGIGGSIDIIAGVVPRAPKIMTSNGLEWLYRFYKEPRRMWKRYLLGNTIFLVRIPLHLLKQL